MAEFDKRDLHLYSEIKKKNKKVVRPKSWLRRTLESARYQAKIDSQTSLLDEMFRQMGERIAESGLPDEEEYRVWLRLVVRIRQEIDYLQECMSLLFEEMSPGLVDEDTRKHELVGGAMKREKALHADQEEQAQQEHRQIENVNEQPSNCFTWLNPIDSDSEQEHLFEEQENVEGEQKLKAEEGEAGIACGE